MAVPGNEGVAGRIKLSKGAIGYVEYGIAQRGDLAMAWLENKAGAFIQPHGGSGLATLLNIHMQDNLQTFARSGRRGFLSNRDLQLVAAV